MAMVASMIFVPLIGNAFENSQLQNVWDLQELSGVRYDSVGSIDLTDNNTVTQGVGINASSSVFTRANSETLSYSTSVVLPTDNFSVSMWAKVNGLPTTGQIFGVFNYCGDVGNKYLEFKFYRDGGGNLQISDGLNNDLYTFSNDTWYFITLVVDTGTLYTYVNADLQWSVSYSSGSPNVDRFVLGDNINCTGGTSYDRYLNGNIDEVYVWNEPLTSVEVTDLYNAGTGLFFPYTSSTSTSTSSTTADISELKWVLELYLAIFMFLLFTWLGYRFTKIFI